MIKSRVAIGHLFFAFVVFWGLFAVCFLSSAFFVTPVKAQNEPTAPDACEDGTQPSGALYRICMPASWNNKLVLYAHGYSAPTDTLTIPQLNAPGVGSIEQLLNLQGYAYATTSYRVNGLAVQQGISDLLELVTVFTQTKSVPQQVILLGASEGGVITALVVEKHPDIFHGGLAMCGPYGSFVEQINHFSDFRVVFDYYFPNLLPGSPITIPTDLMASWESGFFSSTVLPVLSNSANISNVQQLMAVTGAAFDPNDPLTSTVASIEQLLWYNIFATNDAVSKLGGQPFDNSSRVYKGSLDDATLNQNVQRFHADAAALTALTDYETSGKLSRPILTLHTTFDPVVPYRHSILYRAKTILADNPALHQTMEAVRYGHCNFTSTEMLAAFNQIVNLAANPPVNVAAQRLYLPQAVR